MKELNEIETKALTAVNAAINPYGFNALHMDTIDDIIGGHEVGEVWFTLWFLDETKQKNCKAWFEAIYYFKPNTDLNKEIGDIGFGVMDGDFIDLPDDPAKACGIFAKWSQQKTLEQLIKDAEG